MCKRNFISDTNVCFAGKWRHIFLTAVMFHLYFALPAGAAEFTINPYLQDPGTTTMTIMWETDSLAEGSVSFGQGTGAPKVVTVKDPVPAPKGNEAAPYLYAAKLTGLTPGSKYTYSVTAGAAVSKSSHFNTFPEKADSFTFIAYGDSRSRVDIHTKLAANFSRHNPQFIVHSGDFVQDGRNRPSWKTSYFDPLKDVIDHVPLFAAYGNHEKDGVLLDYYFSHSLKGLYYSFDYGIAHFNFLRSTTEEELAWHDKDLASTKALWRFAVYHVPSFAVGGKTGAWGRTNAVPMFHKHKVDVTFVGDSHIYERSFPMVPLSDPTAHPITHIVTGGGGAPLYAAGHNSAVAQSISMEHFLVVTVKRESLTFDVRKMDDTLFESFTINKKDGVFDKDYLATVRPEEIIELYLLLRGSSKGKNAKFNLLLSEQPKPGGTGLISYSYTGRALPAPLEGVITLSKESAADYTLEPAEVPFSILNAEKSKGSFRLKPKGSFSVKEGKNGGISPRLSFDCRVKFENKDRTVSKSVLLKSETPRAEGKSEAEGDGDEK